MSTNEKKVAVIVAVVLVIWTIASYMPDYTLLWNI